jgi:tRNA-uridine 2-sulfurtransferase
VDQAYFLSAVAPDVWSHVLFPVGHLSKARVRALAHAAGLPTAAKRKSVGLCFVGPRKFAPFLGTACGTSAGGSAAAHAWRGGDGGAEEYVDGTPGEFVAVDTGAVVGVCAAPPPPQRAPSRLADVGAR